MENQKPVTLTPKNVALIGEKDIENYITTEEQAIRWCELVTQMSEINRIKNDGTKAKRKFSFVAARKAFFIEHYGVVYNNVKDEERRIEQEAYKILEKFSGKKPD